MKEQTTIPVLLKTTMILTFRPVPLWTVPV